MGEKKLLIFSLILIIGGLLYKQPFFSTVSYGEGIIAPEEPKQSETFQQAFSYNNIIITPLASLELEAKVLSRENYSFDTFSIISPTDLALGWGPMSDEGILKNIEIDQTGRWLSLKRGNALISNELMQKKSANMHIIPANEHIKKQLSKVKKGELVYLKGFLVKLEKEHEWTARSSLSRDDTGNGACEIVWVENLERRYPSDIVFYQYAPLEN